MRKRRDRELAKQEAHLKKEIAREKHNFRQSCYIAKKSSNPKTQLAATIACKIKKEFVNEDRNDSSMYDLLDQLQSNKVAEVNMAHKKYNMVKHLRKQRRYAEQQALAAQMRLDYGSYSDIGKLIAVAPKTIHFWFSKPKTKVHKVKRLAGDRKKEVGAWWKQDTVSTPLGSFKHGQKRFSNDSAQKLYNIYEKDTSFHKHGKVSLTTLRRYRPKEVKPVTKTPLIQCLCSKCLNFRFALKGLISAGCTMIPKDEYEALELSVCSKRNRMYGSDFDFAPLSCIEGKCNKCGSKKAVRRIRALNLDKLQENPSVTWDRWVKRARAPVRITVDAPLKDLMAETEKLWLDDMCYHLFCKDWHRHQFATLKRNLKPGTVLQVLDFSQNFSNITQHEAQYAYWDRTTTSLHGTAMFYKCPVTGCDETVTHEVIHVSGDHKHDSFFVQMCETGTRDLLEEYGLSVEQIIQFVDNCSAQYKSFRPFFFISICGIPIVRVFYGSSHAKGSADSIFGRIKPRVKQAIVSGKVTIKDAHDWFTYCEANFATKKPVEGQCQHYRLSFEYLENVNHKGRRLETVVGTLQFHSVRNVGQRMVIESRNVACVCDNCLSNSEPCLNPAYTKKWKRHKMEYRSEDSNKRRTRSQNNSQFEEQEIDEETFICPEVNEEHVAADLESVSDVEVTAVFAPGDVHTSNFDNPEPQHVPVTDKDCIEILHRWSTVEDFAQLVEEVNKVDTSSMPSFEVDQLPKFSRKCSVDNTAYAEMPRSLRRLLKPKAVTGDGNCWYRTISSSLFNFEEMHVALRLMLIVEACKNIDKYLDDELMSKGALTSYRHVSFPLLFAQYSPYHNPEVERAQMTPDYIRRVYMKEVMSLCHIGSYAGIWQIAQMANTINRPITSHYPRRGEATFVQDFNRSFFPFDHDDASQLQPVNIMWTSSRGVGQLVNHFVPLLRVL